MQNTCALTNGKVHMNLKSRSGTSFHTFLLVKKAHVMMEFTRWGDW